jgi:hypothetical protein
MIVYEVIKSCSISFKKESNEREFGLNTGDLIFLLDEEFWLLNDKNSSMPWEEKYLSNIILKDIYYKKLIDFNGKYEWTWIKNINIINPRINGLSFIRKLHIDKHFRDVSVEWNRDKKINNLLDN